MFHTAYELFNFFWKNNLLNHRECNQGNYFIVETLKLICMDALDWRRLNMFFYINRDDIYQELFRIYLYLAVLEEELSLEE